MRSSLRVVSSRDSWLWKARALRGGLRYGFRMRTAPALVVATLALLALAGCVPDDDPVIPGPLPSSTPIFASDEEALAAAEEALIAYYEVSDLIITEGGARPERLLEVATEAVLSNESTGYAQLIEKGWRGSGHTTVDTVSLQSFDPFAAAGSEVVTVYACVDISAFDLVDANGASVVGPGRVLRTGFEVGFESDQPSTQHLVLTRKDPWTGDDFCGVSQ